MGRDQVVLRFVIKTNKHACTSCKPFEYKGVRPYGHMAIATPAVLFAYASPHMTDLISCCICVQEVLKC